MNTYCPAQRESDKRWDFIRINDRHAYAVGYCAGWREFSGIEGMDPEAIAHFKRQHEMQYGPFKVNYHTDGHASREEAVECYRRYQLDTELKLGIEDTGTMRKCEACGEWTTLSALFVTGQAWTLCAAHNNREEVEKLYQQADRIYSSY